MHHRQRRRKSHKPARAPEAVGPEWYAEQQAQVCVLADDDAAPPQHQELPLAPQLPLPLQLEGPMQLRRPRRRSELPAGEGFVAGAAAAAGACLQPAARVMRVRNASALLQSRTF